jgi:hypothetical protein
MITRPFYKIKILIKERYWEIRYGFDRMRKGYDSADVFELFANFTKRYYKILIEYKKTHCGHPADMSEQEWKDTLNEMIYHLYLMDEHNIHKEFRIGIFQDKPQDCNTINKTMEKHKDKFFELFSKHFYDLWD